MNKLSPESIKRFRQLRVALTKRFPDAAKEAKKLARAVVDPRTADAERVWSIIWDKPLYAYTKVSIAHCAIDSIKDLMIGAWKEMVDAKGPYAIEKIAPGLKKASFSVRGARARKLIKRGHIAPHRFLAIVGGGRALLCALGKIVFPLLI